MISSFCSTCYMNTFGHLFRITTFGESHGPAVGVVVDGCPPGLALTERDFDADLARRKTAQSPLVSSRKEEDQIEILSGVFEGKTLGTPIMLMVRNQGSRPQDYEKFKNVYRPSHADFTWDKKFGIRDWRGGGRASARETVARVMAGVVAKKILTGAEILAYVKQVGRIIADVDPNKVKLSQVEANAVRCPDQKTAKKMMALIQSVQKKGDTVGGVIECVVRGIPAGLGDPVFDKLKATLAHAMMSLPATMGVEFGSGFGSLNMVGSEHNDSFVKGDANTRIHANDANRAARSESTNGHANLRIGTKTNHSGGIQGGISNGMPIIFRVCFKPVSTLFQEQETVDNKGNPVKMTLYGRHDPCVLPRAVVIVEAMAAIVLADHGMRQRAL